MTTTTEVRMLSTMGKKFGRSYQVHLATKTSAEALRWFMAVFPDGRRYLATAHEKGIAFAIFRGRGESRENIGSEQLGEPAGDCITIAPIFKGAKNGGLLSLIEGGVLIGLSLSGVGAVASAALLSTGIGLAAGGVVQMLSPKPKLGTSGNPADQQASYVFSGPVNTTAQGNPVPVVYGRMRIGSAVISAGVVAEDYSSAQSNVGVGTVNEPLAKSPNKE